MYYLCHVKEKEQVQTKQKQKIMKTATFIFDGREFKVIEQITNDDGLCDVYLNGKLFLEGDPGCEDYYGEPAELVDWFKEIFQYEQKYEPEMWASRFAKDEEEEEDEE